MAQRDIAILLLPGFPLMAFSALIEPLRAANLISGSTLYRWQVVTSSGPSETSSSGVPVAGSNQLPPGPKADWIFVCSGGTAHDERSEAAWDWLRRQERRGAALGAVADGTFFLARAGLMDGYAGTIHWQSQAAFAERFPDIPLRPELFVIDRNRYTSAGGIGAFDLIAELIERDHGETLALQVSHWFAHERPRLQTDREDLTLRLRTGLGTRVRDRQLLEAITLMEQTLDAPLSVPRIARQLGLSRDTLERRFRAATGRSPLRFYQDLRLQRAQDYLLHSSLRVGDIALACGYSDPGYFAKCFKERYGVSPGSLRKAH
ncbi:MAG: GlxA family transcriptional regulator [Pseudomonadota bacterium]